MMDPHERPYEIYLRKRKPVAPQYVAVKVPYEYWLLTEDDLCDVGSWAKPWIQELRGERQIAWLIGWDAWGGGRQGTPGFLSHGDYLVQMLAPDGSKGDVFGVQGYEFGDLFKEVSGP